MEYKIVELGEKIVVGVSAKTANNDPDMGKIIGNLWGKLYMGGVYQTINNKANAYAIGLYSDYEGDSYEAITYVTTAGIEVSTSENPELETKIIPAGHYAKFSIVGNMEDLAKAWDSIWQLGLDRSYTGDFEEYLNMDMEHAIVDIYIALK